VHGVGDLHAGAIRPQRLKRVLEDVSSLPAPALHLQIGDATEHGLPEQDAIARDWLARLPGPYGTVLGNHDIMRGRRVAAWARAYDLDSQNFVIDLPFVRLVAVGPADAGRGRRSGLLGEGTLDWLSRQLARSPRGCWIACHWPLRDTVGGDPRRNFTSRMLSFHAKPDRELRALLAEQPNARAWLSGHTHSPLGAPGLVSRVRLGRGRRILAVNLSALVGIGKRRQPTDPLRSVYLTQRPGGMEVRFRDHGERRWLQVGRQPVLRVADV
jgi:3',5'-cyclic AMP phosphodiesterase CpdA